MEIALRLGRRNMGASGPNPAVGCVIVANMSGALCIVGRGWTRRGGRPHAETEALTAAGGLARGATAYVTLEPCSHHGETPPCAQALIDAGIGRVVVAMEDPDRRVAGSGLEALRKAGIAIDVGVGGARAAFDLGGFVSRNVSGRPRVQLKLAVTRDNKIAADASTATVITGELAHARSHLLRAHTDAILIGRGTALADDPELTCRLPGLEDRSPIRVVLDRTLKLPLTSKLVTSAQAVPVQVFCSQDADQTRVDALQSKGVRVNREVSTLSTILAQLAGQGIGRLLVEGGSQIAAEFVSAGLVDELVLFRAPHALGAEALDALSGLSLADFIENRGFVLSATRECGQDIMQTYLRAD